VNDVHVRLVLYKRIAAAHEGGELDELTAELVDRFGPLPGAAQNLLRVARLKLRCRDLGVRRLDLGSHGGYALFEEQNAIDPGIVIGLIQGHQREYRLEGPLKLRIARALAEESKRFDFAAELLRRLKSG